MIQFIYEDVAAPALEKIQVKRWINAVAHVYGKKCGDIAFVFCTDERILEVNKQYLQHDYYTDIITFDDVEGNVINGDIFISVDRVKENSIEFQTSFGNEIHRIIIHGVLHLLGYKDKAPKDKRLMTEKEDLYLKLFNDSYLIK